AQAWEVRCVGYSEVEGPGWVHASGERAVSTSDSTWPQSSASEASGPRSQPPSHADSHAELARLEAGLRPVDPRAGGLLAALGLHVVVFVDASRPLWEPRDLEAVIRACENSNRAVLVSRAPRVWTAREATGLTELLSPACVELNVLHALRIRARDDLVEMEPVLAEPWKGWSLRVSTERLAIASVWKERHAFERQDRLPLTVGALVMDFDGVLTDNRVLVQQDGTESVACHRGDGLGIELLRKSGLPLLVISKEKNPVVQARCSKLKVPCLSGVDEKLTALQDWCERKRVSRHQVVFVGNDINDLECLTWAGCGVAVQDSHPEVLRSAALTLENPGGYGAIRELAEMILLRNGVRLPVHSVD